MNKKVRHYRDHAGASYAMPITDIYSPETERLKIGPAFDELFAYDGVLGVQYSPQASLFRLWSPVAVSVDLVLYDGLYSNRKRHLPMQEVANGTFEIEVTDDLDNTAYMYAVHYPDGSFIETVDPYATAVTLNGERSVVVNLASTNPENWTNRMTAFSAPTDAIIYEAHIRDFTFSEQIKATNRAKFLGVIEEGLKTTNGKTAGFDYLKELGITHLQLLPMYDFQTVDEKYQFASYNWGYDPQNYNVPEGSYATDPSDPKTRIREMKQMVQGLHDAGIRVIMDVVYNHVYEPIGHPFENVAPGYYFRQNPDGSPSNGTGVGNDTASERLMMRRYIVDSVRYWAEEYHIDGFRFDLMGIHDVETMLEIRAALDEIDPSIIMIGEGWNLDTNLPADQKANAKNAHQMPRIAHFNDALRTAIKGRDMDGGHDTGIVTGKSFMEQWVAINQQGGAYYPQDVATYQEPDQVVQYIEAHDNFTLYDKLKLNMPSDDETTRAKRHLLAQSMAFLAQGIPFIHAGQEFFRTKQGVENSYKSPDAINFFDWELKDKNQFAVDYMKGLIALRRSEPLFRMQTADQIIRHMSILKADYYQVVWQLEDEDHSYYVLFNANGNAVSFDIELGDYELLVKNQTVNLDHPEQLKNSSSIVVDGFSTTILRMKK